MARARDPVALWVALGRPLSRLPRRAALALLAALAAAMAWSALAAGPPVQAETPRQESHATPDADGGDLALYRRISERVIAGEDYYPAAMAQQRAGNYPTRPFVTVRLPTLAMVHKAIGFDGANALALALLAITIVVMMHRLREQTRPSESIAAGVLLLLGGAAAITPEAGLIHELLAGLLLALALALYHPARWWPALLAAGAALAVRELALPFVLLWLGFAVIQRRWQEVAGLGVLLLAFAAGLCLHYLGVEAQRLPGDAASQGWDGLAGFALPLFALSKLTPLLFLPGWLAAPLAILPLVGWLGLGGRLGLFAFLWFVGLLSMVALFARTENFYWVQLALPALFAGFAFVPRALADLAQAAGLRTGHRR